MRLGVLCSGNLGFEILIQIEQNFDLNFVFTDSKSEQIVEFCQNSDIPFFMGNPRKGKASSFIEENNCDILVSVNYLFLIEKDVINMAKLLTFNVHGSLLPKYRGRTPHVWAIINGEKQAGITAHVIDENCDTGDILLQQPIAIEDIDTGNDILQKYHNNYFPLIKEVIDTVRSNSLEPKPQNNAKATYFGKRTPDDGQIDWCWQKQRLKNWIRAQAYPYPGAFTFYQNQKVIIDSIKFSDCGYNYNDKNGLIIKTKPLLVKTPNGVVEVTSYRENINFERGKTFI